jgi:hypothetical protein
VIRSVTFARASTPVPLSDDDSMNSPWASLSSCVHRTNSAATSSVTSSIVAFRTT